MQLKMYGDTDIGFVRKANQDSHFYNEDYGIAIVSDGMGGHQGGEIASNLVVAGLRESYLASPQILLENIGSFLDDVLRKINSQILQQGNDNPSLLGMGATVNYLQFAGGVLAIGHAGDSRTYLARIYSVANGENFCGLWQLTVDHNVGNFLDRGIIPSTPALKNMSERQRSRLTRGMGVMEELKSDLYMRKLQNGDVFLTCSDGLHGFVSNTDIMLALCAGSLKDAPLRLIEKAKQAGAPDNVTVVISYWGESPELFPMQALNDFIGHPFLVRMPSGDILGPWEGDKVSKKWQNAEIPFDAEVSSGGQPWVFLRQSKQIFELYPSLEKPGVKDFLSRIEFESMQAASRILTPIIQKSKSKKTLMVVIIFIFIIIVFLAMLTLMEYNALHQSVM